MNSFLYPSIPTWWAWASGIHFSIKPLTWRKAEAWWFQFSSPTAFSQLLNHYENCMVDPHNLQWLRAWLMTTHHRKRGPCKLQALCNSAGTEGVQELCLRGWLRDRVCPHILKFSKSSILWKSILFPSVGNVDISTSGSRKSELPIFN